VISDLDIYRAANLLIERHGADAVIEAVRASDRESTLGDAHRELSTFRRVHFAHAHDTHFADILGDERVRKWILAVSLCLLAAPVLARGDDQGGNNNNQGNDYRGQSNDHHGAPAPLIGAGIEGLMAIGGVLLGSRFFRRPKKQS
jgi:hypothetical protein